MAPVGVARNDPPGPEGAGATVATPVEPTGGPLWTGLLTVYFRPYPSVNTCASLTASGSTNIGNPFADRYFRIASIHTR